MLRVLSAVIDKIFAYLDWLGRLLLLAMRQLICPVVKTLAPSLESALKELGRQATTGKVWIGRGIGTLDEVGTIGRFSRLAFRWAPWIFRFAVPVAVSLIMIYVAVGLLAPVYLAVRQAIHDEHAADLVRAKWWSDNVFSRGGYAGRPNVALPSKPEPNPASRPEPNPASRPEPNPASRPEPNPAREAIQSLNSNPGFSTDDREVIDQYKTILENSDNWEIEAQRQRLSAFAISPSSPTAPFSFERLLEKQRQLYEQKHIDPCTSSHVPSAFCQDLQPSGQNKERQSTASVRTEGSGKQSSKQSPCARVLPKNEREILMMEVSSNKVGCWTRGPDGNLAFISDTVRYRPLLGTDLWEAGQKQAGCMPAKSNPNLPQMEIIETDVWTGHVQQAGTIKGLKGPFHPADKVTPFSRSAESELWIEFQKDGRVYASLSNGYFVANSCFDFVGTPASMTCSSEKIEKKGKYTETAKVSCVLNSPRSVPLLSCVFSSSYDSPVTNTESKYEFRPDRRTSRACTVDGFRKEF